jgi:hypothetical protein
MEAETGYRDAGELFRCLDCGARGPAEDAEFQPAPRFGPQRQTVPTIAAKADVV